MAFVYDPWASDEEDEYLMYGYDYEGHEVLFDPIFDDDLEDMVEDHMDSDSMDSDYSDIHDSTKIFMSLLDSHVVHSLNFHRDIEWSYDVSVDRNLHRLPKLKPGVSEHYESLVKLLDELELLIRVWRRRTQHALTAHIDQLSRARGEDREEEEDWDDALEDHDSHCRQEINMGLTKKKFCNSTIIFNVLFGPDIPHSGEAAEEEDGALTCDAQSVQLSFDTFYDSIRQARKLVRKVALTNFLDALSPQVRLSLPTEVWEHIWCLAQHPFTFNEKGAIRMGIKEKSNKQRMLLEQSRLNDLFTAVGHIHMLVFEILFKHPHLIRHPPLHDLVGVELRRKLDPKAPLKHNFNLHYNMFVRALNRWNVCVKDANNDANSSDDLEVGGSHRLEDNACKSTNMAIGKTNNAPPSVTERVDGGFITVRGAPPLKGDLIASIDKFALVCDSMNPPTLSLWTLDEPKLRRVHKFKCNSEDVLSSMMRSAPFASSSLLDFNEHYLVLTDTLKNDKDRKSNLVVYDLRDSPKKLKDRRHVVKGFKLSSGRTYCSKIVKQGTSNKLLVLSYYKLRILNLEDAKSEIEVIELNGNGTDAQAVLMAANSQCALIAESRESIVMIDLHKKCQVFSVNTLEIGKEAGHIIDNSMRSSFFAAIDEQFGHMVIFCQNLTAYRLYDMSGEPPFKILAKGSSVHFGLTRNNSTSRRGPIEGVTLYQGNLFILAPPTSTAYPSNAAELSVVNLMDEQPHPKPRSVCVVVGNSITWQMPFLYSLHETVFEVDYVLHDFCKPLINRDEKGEVLKITLVWEGGVAHVTLYDSLEAVNDVDGSHLITLEVEAERKREYERLKKEEEKKLAEMRREEERKSARIMRAQRLKESLTPTEYEGMLARKMKLLCAEKREKYVNNGMKLQGKFIHWSNTYGFIKVLADDSFPLNVFCHNSAFVGRAPEKVADGTMVKFEVEESEDGIRVQAAEVEFLDAQEKQEALDS